MRKLWFDIECYTNYFLIMLLAEDGRVAIFEQYSGHPLDVEKVTKIFSMPDTVYVSFNGNGYDWPMIRYAMTGVSCEQLKKASDDIIVNNLKPWNFERKYSCSDLKINHIDLIEVAPGQSSLKLYAGRIHVKHLQDLPIDPAAMISPEQREELKRYCRKDVAGTKALYDTLRSQIELREQMTAMLRADVKPGDKYVPDDLRSKSDAQIAESVLKHRVYLATGSLPKKTPIDYTSFKYEPPSYIQFGEPVLKKALETILNAEMVIDPDTGHVKMPAEISDMVIDYGGCSFKVGIGGLHSQESEVTHVAKGTHILRDIDVRSYYPNLMLNMGMVPEAIGPTFLTEFRNILKERLVAKDNGDKVKDATLKIVLNGSFGKTASQYSILYGPKMMIGTTLTGQLSILMLIEGLVQRGITVVSANTDGIVVKYPKEMENVQRQVVKAWESICNLETEETDYLSIHARDVNSYIAIKRDGKLKLKGFFAKAGLAKNPQNEICVDAMIALLTKRVPIAQTVRECADLRKFLTVKRVTGGAVKDDNYLGKAIRWYYSSETKGVIRYQKDGKIVGRSAGAKPCMDLPDEFPSDIDYDWYIQETKELLMDVALLARPVKPKLPRRGTKKWKELESQGLVEVDDYGKPCWACHIDMIPDEFKQQ